MNRRPKILTIDDSRSVQARYHGILTAMGADIDSALNGESGLEKALAKRYDLIITDVKMPKMSGIDLCHALQAVPKTRRIPVIIISDFSSEKDIENGFEAGAAAYISKSDVQDQLPKTVREILSSAEPFQQRTVLVVEDSKAIQRYVEMGLTNAGFTVQTALNGKEALGILAAETPDLILSDINMPFVDGFELCRHVTGNARLSKIPFVVMSSNDDRVHMDRMMQYGAAAYVVKPFSLDQLIGLIDKIMSDQFLLMLKERERLETERSGLLASVSKVVDALDQKDPYASYHSQKVSSTASRLLTIIGASRQDIESITVAARLHNIGNVGIRDSVLLKPWKLSDDEMAHVRQHPIIGKQIIETVPSLSEVREVVYYHHERWDGAGYPEGLRRERIPLWARITGVADTYHALTSDRPYRAAHPETEAIDIIKKERETSLCPESVDAFLAWRSAT